MDALFNQLPDPTETCCICFESFNDKHLPVALPCKHILGYECIKDWLFEGSGNTNSCPQCRHPIFERPDPDRFAPASLWKALCVQPPKILHEFVKEIWEKLMPLWSGRLSAHFEASELLSQSIIPALRKMSGGRAAAFVDSHNLVVQSWYNRGWQSCNEGLAVPLIRLARLMSQVSSVLPKWLTGLERMNVLVWNANASIGLTGVSVDWNHIVEAAKLDNRRYFPLLHLYTVVISQTITTMEVPRPWPTRRHEVMNLARERCCRKIGAEWGGNPSNEFMDRLVAVFEELKRHQLDDGRVNLQGHAGEEHVVAGLWGMAKWQKASPPRVEQSRGTSSGRGGKSRGGIMGSRWAS